MNLIRQYLQQYLDYCKGQKCLDFKTIKSYKIDLRQYQEFSQNQNACSKETLNQHITILHQKFKPKTVKRKIASLKAFFNYLVYEEIIELNPITKIRIKFQEPKLLPRTIPQILVEKILSQAYADLSINPTDTYAGKTILRDICVLELLFATGVRISELCNLRPTDFDWNFNRIRVNGKGNRERIIQICNNEIINILKKYKKIFQSQIKKTGKFFINRLGRRLSEQSVRFMICKYSEKVNSPIRITPHMFRHTFATALLEENVDIRYIQKMLGHNSITTTEIYTHVTSVKQNEILKTQHPRNKMNF